MKRALEIFSWIALLGCVTALVGFTQKQKGAQSLSTISINIDKPANSRFVTSDDIKTLYSNLGYQLDNQNLSAIDIHQLETLLKNNSSVEKAQVYHSINGKLIVEIKERTPIIRLYNTQNESFYLDKFGSLMPLSNKYAARVLIANGAINIPFSTVHQLEHLEDRLNKLFRKQNTTAVENTQLITRLKLELEEENLTGAAQLKQLFDLARFITNDKFWNSQISQIFVNKNNDVEMIPRVGNHTIVLGEATELEEKFQKLLIFYKKGLNNTGWNNYSNINLKYKNQVVCTKR
ncbi:MAG: cell division protein FtsQ [Salibacteraceae bacterium]